jgi:hypothetical protein
MDLFDDQEGCLVENKRVVLSVAHSISNQLLKKLPNHLMFKCLFSTYDFKFEHLDGSFFHQFFLLFFIFPLYFSLNFRLLSRFFGLLFVLFASDFIDS